MEPSNDVIRSFLISHKLLLNHFETAFAAAGGPSVYETGLLLITLEQPDGRLSMDAARGALGFTRSGISRMVDRMVKAGWLRRWEGEQDRRFTFVSVTDAGQASLRLALEAYGQAFESGFLANLSEAELVQLVALLDKLSEGLAPT